MEPGEIDVGGILLDEGVTLFELGEVLLDTGGMIGVFTETGGIHPRTRTEGL